MMRAPPIHGARIRVFDVTRPHCSVFATAMWTALGSVARGLEPPVVRYPRQSVDRQVVWKLHHHSAWREPGTGSHVRQIVEFCFVSKRRAAEVDAKIAREPKKALDREAVGDAEEQL